MSRSNQRLFIRLCALIGIAASPIIIPMASADAQGPSLNLGHGFRPRFFNATRYDDAHEVNVGTTRFILNAYVDTPALGPVRVSVEQGGRAVMNTTCRTEHVNGSTPGGVDAQSELRECATQYVDASTIRGDQPVDIVLRAPRGNTEVEFYRGTFPVIAFRGWEGNRNGQPVYVEQRGLRLDSMYGVGFVRQYGHRMEFSFVTTQADENAPSAPTFRCKVGAGAFTTYRAELSGSSTPEVVFNRVFRNDELQETRIVTNHHDVVVELPIAVEGRSQRPRAGTSLDGAWTCELEVANGDARVVLREFRFDVRNGYVAHHAIESEVAAGRGAALVAVGFRSDAMPAIFDPAIVRAFVVGRRLTSGTAPVVAGMPTRAVNPSFGASDAASPPSRARREQRRR